MMPGHEPSKHRNVPCWWTQVNVNRLAAILPLPEGQSGLRRPKCGPAERAQGKLRLEFPDDIFTIGPAIEITPDFQGAGGQAGDQRLKEITRHIDQLFAPGPVLVREAMADEHQAPRVRPGW